jgi:glycine/D-amino acid oxidase-like deaminating enzyme
VSAAASHTAPPPGHVHDVAVVGGGVLGGFIAYDLARVGLDTVLVERGYTAAGTSGATHAWIFISTKTPGFYGRFSYESSLRYEALAREHGVDFQYERSGGLSLLWTDAALEEAHRIVRDQNAAGIACEVLTPEEVSAREPIVSPRHIKGAIYGPLDGCVNPFSVMYAMNRLAREAGAHFRPYSDVTAIVRDASGFRLATSSGEVRARRLVLAAGVWSIALARLIGFELPIRPSRGQVLVSAPMPPTVRHILANGSVRQLAERGIILMGRVMENDQTDNATTYEGLQKALRDVLALAPSLGDVSVVRSYAGIRPKPFDDLPVLGEVPGHPGVFTAVTHSGVTLGPVIGLSLAELMTGRPTTHDLTPYHWDRVAKVRA